MSTRLMPLTLALLLLQALPAWAVCKDYGNFSPTPLAGQGKVIGGVRYGDYKQDKITAYFYGQACWRASEIAEEGHQRIFYKLIASRDAEGRIASYVSTADSAPGLFPCPPGSQQQPADGKVFDAVDGPRPGMQALVCIAKPD